MATAMLREDANAEYTSRLEELRIEETREERRHSQLGIAKIVVVVAVLGLLGWYLKTRAVLMIGLVPLAALFVALEVAHSSALRSLARCRALITFYERGLARLRNEWMGTGETGDLFLDPAHPYARDLDLFGRGSLFELLCTARTNAGQELLANWLKKPASLAEIARRQAGVQELRARLDLRAEMAIFGEGVRTQVHSEALTTWAEATAGASPGRARLVAGILCAVWLGTVVAWAIWGVWEVVVLIGAVNLVVNTQYKSRMTKNIATEEFENDLKLLGGVMRLLEAEKFSSPKLLELQTNLCTEGELASQAIRRLRRLIESLESRDNLALRVVDPFILWTAQFAFAIEAWRQRYGQSVRQWLSAVGEIEALISLAGYTYEHSADVFPEFVESGSALLEAEGLAHPLLPAQQAVSNDLRLGSELRLMIVSGPNMSGKSTLIRAVGINAVLAQCGAPVRARGLRMSRLQLGASICVLDSLQGGVSRFYAEITRVKAIAELTAGPLPVLFLLDELLGGTNSNDRRVGAEAVVRSLVTKGAIGLVTTHDLALTLMAQNMNGQAGNFHFEDRIENGHLRFYYQLVPGVATSSNALKLMRSIGLEV
jgi:MutS domain V